MTIRYPLTAAQDILFVQKKYSYSKSILNVNVIMHLETEVEDEIFLQAMYLAVMRNQSASMRLCKTKEGIRQYFSSEGPAPIPVKNFEASEEAMMEELRKVSGTAFPQGGFDTQLYRILYLKKPEGKRAVFFSVSHLIFDAFALLSMGQDALEIYHAMVQGLSLPKPKPSPLKVYEADWNYQQSGQIEEDLAFWEKINETEPLFTSVNGLGSPEFAKGTRKGNVLKLWQIKADFMNFRLSAEIVRKAEHFAQAHQIPLQAIYLLAIRNFLSMRNGMAEDIVFYNSVARRATLAQKNAGGTMVSAVPFRMKYKNSLSFLEALQEVASLQVKYYRHCNLPFRRYVTMISEKYKVAPMQGYSNFSMTFQPYVATPPGGMRIRLERLPSGYAAIGLYLTIMAVDDSGELLFNFEYIKGNVKEESIRLMFSYLENMLDYAVDHPEKTLEQLMKIPY